MSLRAAVAFVFGELGKRSYAFHPAFQSYLGTVTFDLRGKSYGELVGMVRQQIRHAGFVSEFRDGVFWVEPSVEVAKPELTRVYRPKFRSVQYLTGLVEGVVKGRFAHQRAVQGDQPVAGETPTSVAGLQTSDADVLIFTGVADEVRKLDALLTQLDLAPLGATVRAALVEVRKTKRDGSALSIIGSVLGGKLGIEFGADGSGDVLRISSGRWRAVLAALGEDSRFRSVAEPTLALLDGKEALLEVGQEVPTLSEIVTQGQQSQQSVTYRSAGVILRLRPTITAAGVTLQLQQEVSDFVTTETSEINSPTLLKRAIATHARLEPGQVLVIGGLRENRQSAGERGLGWLPKWLRSRSSEDQEAELVLMLSVDT